MGISYRTQKQKLTKKIPHRSALYVLSLLSTKQSSGRKRRLFVAGILTTAGTFACLYPYSSHAQLKITPLSSRVHTSSYKKETIHLADIALKSLYSLIFTATSITTLIYLLKERFLRHNAIRPLLLYVPYNYNIRGSPLRA